MSEAPRHFQKEAGGFLVEALWQRLGKDYLLSVWGGVAHIGAVAMAQPRPSLADASRLSATASVFCYVGHKEDAVVKELSERLAAGLGAKVVVAAGLHWDNLPPEGIRQVQENVRALVEMIVVEERTGRHHG
jgi:gallate decarboxylase subunit D